MIYRKKYIDEFRSVLKNGVYSIIAISGPYWIWKSTFIKECEAFDVFGKKDDYQHIELKDADDLSKVEIKNGVSYIIVDSKKWIDITKIRTFIESLLSDIKVIFCSEEQIFDDDVSIFALPPIGLREYLEHEVGNIVISDLLQGSDDIVRLNKFRDIYIKYGGYPEHLFSQESIKEDFERKKSIVYQELFEKEHSVFEAYLRTIAMSIWGMFKADQVAKLLNISRRKVNKYTDLVLKYDIMKSVNPWVEDTQAETSRHIKLYFSDFSYPKAILWEIHWEWALKQWAVENLIFLELTRKLSPNHTIYFYRKKSGAEISFIIEDEENTLLTPIEVTTRSSDVIPQVLRIFDEEYNNRVERYMIFNDSKGWRLSLNDKQVMILPHVGI